MEELSLLVESLIGTLIGLTVLLLLFSTGLALTFRQATMLWRKPKKLALSLLASVVLAPLAAYTVLYLSSQFMDIPVEIIVGVMLLSAASGAAMAPKFAEIGADIADATSLMVTLVLTSILSVPIIVALTMPPEFAITGAEVAASVFKSVLLPLIIGLAIRTWWIRLADLITEPLTKLSDNLMKVIIILIIIKDLDVILGFGLSALVVILLISVIYVLIGHFLGGPGMAARVTLGLSTVFRNGSVALILAAQALPAAIPAIVGFDVVVIIVAVLYLGMFNKKEAVPAEPTVGSQ